MTTNLKRAFAAMVFAILGGISPILAQTAFEDAKGDGSIVLKDQGGFARINVGDTSAKIAYLFDMSNQKVYYGFEVSGKLSGDFASLFGSGKPSPEAKFSALVGRRFLFSKKPMGAPTKGPLTDDWLTFRVGYRRARYKILSEDNSFDEQVRKQNFDGFSAIVAYNALFKWSKGPLLLGVASGAERRNNIDDLDEVEVNDEVFTSSSGSTQRSVVARDKAFSGVYKESTAVPIYTDLVWFPKQFESRIGLNFFTRSNVGQGDRNFEPGIGLFFTKAGSPTRVLGGISVSARDGKGRVGLIAGFNF
jgi:hypothetical protein